MKQQNHDTYKAIGSKVKSHDAPTESLKAPLKPFNCEAYSFKICRYFFNCTSPTIPRVHQKLISARNFRL